MGTMGFSIPPARMTSSSAPVASKRPSASLFVAGPAKANETAALAAFNDKNNKEFHDRDLYVFCFNMSDGKYSAHVNSALMNTDIRDLKILGEPVGARVYAAAKEGAVSTLDFNFPRPGTTEPVPKEAYITRVGNQGCGVGYYK